jgi:hypothetical protein
MALITLPSSPEKGVAQNYSLNLTDLFALVTDSYYTTQDNISKIIILYASSTGNQLENITFTPDGVSTTLSTSAMFASQAFDLFDVSFIAIIDKQNGRYIVPAASIPDVVNYEIDFAAAPVSYTFSNSLKSSDITLSNGNLTAKRTSAAAGPYVSALIDNAFMLSSSQKIYLELTVDLITSSSAEAIGFDFQNGTPSVFDSGSVTIPGFYGVQGPRIVWQGNSLYQQTNGGSAAFIGPVGYMVTGQVIGIAVDIQAQTFSFNNNGSWSSTFSFSGIVGDADRIYFAVGPHLPSPGSEDSFTKNTSSIYTPSGYTLI